jgi:hypothetical protein
MKATVLLRGARAASATVAVPVALTVVPSLSSTLTVTV